MQSIVHKPLCHILVKQYGDGPRKFMYLFACVFIVTEAASPSFFFSSLDHFLVGFPLLYFLAFSPFFISHGPAQQAWRPGGGHRCTQELITFLFHSFLYGTTPLLCNWWIAYNWFTAYSVDLFIQGGTLYFKQSRVIQQRKKGRNKIATPHSMA